MTVATEAARRLDLVVPRPTSAVVGDGEFTWTDPQTILVDETSRSDAFAAGLLAEAVADRGLPGWSVDIEAKDSRVLIGQRHRAIEIHELLGSDLPAYQGIDGYWLRITPEHVVVLGESAAGVYYGVQTLIALLPDDGNAALPAIEISDSPALRIRGFMQDYGRRQVPTLASLKCTVERLGAMKLNTFFPYFEDTLEFASHPEICADRDRLTAAEMRALVAHARNHHVRVVPIIQGLGHMNDMLSTPGLESLREAPDKDNIDPSNPAATRLLEDLIADTVAIFPDPLFHAGMDETFGLGTGRSKAYADRIGAGGLFAGQVHRLQEILERHDKRMIVWSDQFEPGFFARFNLASLAEDLVDQMPRDVIVSSWHYGDEQEFPGGKLFKELGFEQILWGALGHCLELVHNFPGTEANARSFMGWAHELGALGGVASQWEDVYENVPFDLTMAGLAYFSECLWTSSPRTLPEVLDGWMAREFGVVSAELRDAFLALGSINEVIDWGGALFRAPALTHFFNGPAPAQMTPEQLARVEALERRLADAASTFDKIESEVSRGHEMFDLWRFGLRQTQLLVAMMLYRHALSTGGEVDADPIVTELQALVSTYRAIWARDNKPRNLDRSAQRYVTLLEAWQPHA